MNGQKVWNTGAGARDLTLSVYLKTDTTVHYRDGMSLFLIDNDAPGVSFNKLDMLGRRCTGTYEVFFTDVRVDDSRIIGGENKGWDGREVQVSFGSYYDIFPYDRPICPAR